MSDKTRKLRSRRIVLGDIRVQHEGSLALFHMTSGAGERWVKEHVETEETQYWGGALVVEHRYVHDLIEGMRADGLCVEVR